MSTGNEPVISKPGIAPHTEQKGVDIAGYNQDGGSEKTMRILIFRSHLGPGLYMEAYPNDSSQKPVVRQMFPVMRCADHYFATNSKFLYMIKGDQVALMKIPEKDDTEPRQFSTFELHPTCRGGDHYIGFHDNYFVIIYQKKGTYRVINDLKTGQGEPEEKLADNYKNSIYFWGSAGVHAGIDKKEFCFLDQINVWNGVPLGTKMYDPSKSDYTHSIFPLNLVKFLPGGTSLSIGPSTGCWSLIKSIGNESGTDIKWEKGATMTVGYNKEVSDTIEHNWEVNVTMQTTVSKLIVEYNMSLSATYGGSHVSTTGQSWSKEEKVEESLSVTVKSNQTVYLWQYKVDMGDEPMLFTKNLATTTTNIAPTYDPLPLITE